MKMWEWFKIFNLNKVQKKQKNYFSLNLNNEILENMKVISNKLHSRTYYDLRKYKTPQYGMAYVLRNKKAFNTIGFTINYDIIVCDKNGKVIDLLQNCLPGEISKFYANSHFIYFATVGTINFHKLKELDILRLIKKWL